MAVDQCNIVAVSYLNTIPFIYGIEQSSELGARLLLAPPSECARNYATGLADIALVPAAVVPQLSASRIVTSYCIGARGPVRTVALFSDEPLGEVRRIWLDPHSLTSVQLVRYLAARAWKIAPQWAEFPADYAPLARREHGDAYLLIGDKVFDHEGSFRYVTDLAEAWYAATRLPFAFAVWVARDGVPPERIDALEHALTFGVEHTWEAILASPYADRPYAYEYLTRNIDPLFDHEKQRALKKFWDAGMKTAPRVKPG